ncbi:hypothetical protein [Geodermatophilus sp. DF01-2]|nr:hypothetical protein [Geodermatophilus sp. DF01_2]
MDRHASPGRAVAPAAVGQRSGGGARFAVRVLLAAAGVLPPAVAGT